MLDIEDVFLEFFVLDVEFVDLLLVLKDFLFEVLHFKLQRLTGIAFFALCFHFRTGLLSQFASLTGQSFFQFGDLDHGLLTLDIVAVDGGHEFGVFLFQFLNFKAGVDFVFEFGGEFYEEIFDV